MVNVSKLTDEERKERRLEAKRRYREKNREKIRSKQNEYYAKNKDVIKERNKPKKKQYDKTYSEKNKEKILKSKKKYYYKNKAIIREKQNEYQKEKRRNDIGFRIRGNLRGRLRVCLNPEVQMETTTRLISCSPKLFFNWLEYQFDAYMNWNNYGEYWVLDHVKPLSLFNLNNRSERLESMHWSNIRPFQSIENIRKNDKYDNKLQHLHNIVIKSFLLKTKNDMESTTSLKWTIRSEAS